MSNILKDFNNPDFLNDFVFMGCLWVTIHGKTYFLYNVNVCIDEHFIYISEAGDIQAYKYDALGCLSVGHDEFYDKLGSMALEQDEYMGYVGKYAGKPISKDMEMQNSNV